ncbi:hypothetical protein B0H19DRAFT_1070642 [Mycena capillaripes]|nr:hypothetical protein B0H19DRAFT_1070642 [Mycena capillaripes]
MRCLRSFEFASEESFGEPCILQEYLRATGTKGSQDWLESLVAERAQEFWMRCYSLVTESFEESNKEYKLEIRAKARDYNTNKQRTQPRGVQSQAIFKGGLGPAFGNPQLDLHERPEVLLGGGVRKVTAALPSTNVATAPAGAPRIITIATSTNITLCVISKSDLSVNGSTCTTNVDYIAWTPTVGSAASTTPPLGPITHQYIPEPTLPKNGTFCLAANISSTNPATVPDGTIVNLAPCVSGNAMQQWGWREGDGTIRLGNTNNLDGFPDTLQACFFDENGLTGTAQNFTFVAGSSFIGKGAPGPITSYNGSFCLQPVPNPNNASIISLGNRACNGSSDQQWQVNSDGTINIANTNKCIGQSVGIYNINTAIQVTDCVPGNTNQIWKILQALNELV